MKLVLGINIIILLACISCQMDKVDPYGWGDHLGNSVQIGMNIISVDVSDTRQLRMIGLSQHEELDSGHGMLFVYPDAAERTYWMKGMQFPIDIIWIGADCNIGNLTENIPIPDETSEIDGSYLIYESGKPAQFVLEMNAGYINKNKVFIGDSVVFLDPLSGKYAC